MVNLLSTKSGGRHKGTEIETNTFINDGGPEAGVPHHYFDEKGVSLSEQAPLHLAP